MLFPRLNPLVAGSLVVIALRVAACGDDGGNGAETPACDVTAQTGCPDNLVCEQIEGGQPGCFAPVEVRGQVFDALDESGIGGATVVALDVNGFARSNVVETDNTGNYVLSLPVTRDAEGTPLGTDVTLRVDAMDYLPFPLPPRTAIPIPLINAAEPNEQDDGPAWVVENAATEGEDPFCGGETMGLV